jgi:hypothetical protein
VLGRKSYTREELDDAHRAIDEQLASCRALAGAAAAAGPDGKLRAALDDFEPVFSTRMVLVLDRFFVHRLRTVTGEDTNPLKEVELLTESLLNNGGVFRSGNVVKWVPEQSVLGLQAGDRIRLTADDLGRPATAFLVELADQFLQVSGSAARPGRRPWRPRRGSPAAGRAPSRCSGPGWPSSAR